MAPAHDDDTNPTGRPAGRPPTGQPAQPAQADPQPVTRPSDPHAEAARVRAELDAWLNRIDVAVIDLRDAITRLGADRA